MARIRSIHPALFTDEAFMSASAFGRLLIIGLWCEAFDDGVVELKTLTLKARIFPADNVDMGELLSELEDLNYFRRFSAHGKAFLAIRNFQRFQRPKKPNSSEVLPQNLISYVGGSPPVPHQYGTNGGNPPQREEGGDHREEEKEEKSSVLSDGQAEPADEPAKEPAFEFRHHADPEVLPPERHDPPDEAAVFRRGKEVLGKTAGGQINKLWVGTGRNPVESLAVIEEAASKQDPAEWFAARIRASPRPSYRPDPYLDAARKMMDRLNASTH